MPKSANKTAATPTTEAPAWALIWPNLKIFILSRFAWERMKTDEQEKIRAEYGEGLAILDWVAAQKFDPQKLLVIERRTWKQIPEDIREKLRNEYGEGDGLRVLADDFLVMKDSKNYPTSQRGNALLFCALRARDYVHTQKPAAGYVWRKLAADASGNIGGFWERDEGDAWLRAEVNKLTDEFWDLYLSIRVYDDTGKSAGGNAEEEARKARNELLTVWKKTIRDRYDSFANYEFDKILTKIKDIKDEERVIMNDPARCAGLLPCLNGVYELAAGTFRSARKSDYMSYFAPTVYDPAAEDKIAREALDLFFDAAKDKSRAAEVEKYFWELTGTALYPEIRKDTKAMVQLVGVSTNNGKTTITKALMAALGDASGTGLAKNVRAIAFAKIKGANTSTLTPDYAAIGWARLVFVSEPDENLRLNWAEIKNLTGGGVMNINPKNRDMYTIPAQFTMFWDTNYYLRVDDPTLFSRGTMRLVPFEHIFRESDRDPEIDRKLSTPAARSYLLRLMIEGLHRYLSNGFSVPPICQKMLSNYEENSDKLGEFLSQNYVKTGRPADKIMLKKEMYPRFVEWCEENGFKGVESCAEFTRKLQNRPGIIIGTRNNAKTMDGWTTAENATKADQFSGKDPLSWYIETYTAEDTPAEGEQQALAGTVSAAKNPALTLDELRRDYSQKVKAADPAAEVLDIFGLWAELMKRGVKLETYADNIGRSLITGRHIITPEEKAARRAAEAKELHRKMRESLTRKIDILNEESKRAILYLIRTEALAGLLGELAEGQAEALTSALLTGGGLDRAIGRKVDEVLRSKF